MIGVVVIICHISLGYSIGYLQVYPLGIRGLHLRFRQTPIGVTVFNRLHCFLSDAYTRCEDPGPQ